MRTSFYSRFSVLFSAFVLSALLLSGCVNDPNNTDSEPDSKQASTNSKASIQVLGPDGATLEISNVQSGDLGEHEQYVGNDMVLENVSAGARDDRAAAGTPEQAPAPGLISFAPLNATYEEYTRARYDMVKGRKAFAIFFSAEECADCVKMDTTITSDLVNFPEGSYVLKADYAKDAAIRREYGATAAGTVLVFDGQGNVIYSAQNFLLDDLKAAIAKSLGV